ncbi:MAG: hypothetical protein Q8Q30_02290 [Candidatus Woesebacteria bacterium]|nr:hypothetical protein [Candidatus Woesebacteria bacterium]
MLKKVTKQFSLVSLIILGTITWSLTMIRSGINYSFGYGFWGPNGHDGIWHIALSKSLVAGSLNNPVFAGDIIKNYHLGFDLLLALLNKLTTIPISILYFQILPPIFALIIGLLVYLFVLNWRGSKNEALWSTAFVYFSSSFGFIVTFLRDGIFTGESMFWSQQSISTLVNPPFALSLIFILAGLISLQKKNLLLSILFFGLLIQIKAYSAILVLGALFVSGLYQYYIQHTTFYIRVFIGSLIINLILFSYTKSDSLAVFIWQPMWFLETLMSYSDRLGWERFYSAMTTYKMGRIWFKEILAYGTAFIIFLIGNMGLRIIGFNHLFKAKIDSLLVFIVTILSMAVIIPMFFVQKGTPWNTIQFFYYYLFFFSIFAGISISKMKDWVKVLFIIFAIFGIWSTLQHYLPKMPQAMVSSEEYIALDFLAKQPDGIVFTYPFDKYKAKEAEKFSPRPLYLYESTSYVSAFTDKPVFLEDQVNLNIMGYGWESRQEEMLKFISTLDIATGREFLIQNNIKYLYLVKEISPLSGELLRLGSTELGLKKIFENKEVIIYGYGENFGGS